MIMQAIVIEVQWGRLLVLDLDTRQQVIVNTSEFRRFRTGDLVNIWYNGVMTKSIPPQITALGIIAVQGEMPPLFPPGAAHRTRAPKKGGRPRNQRLSVKRVPVHLSFRTGPRSGGPNGTARPTKARPQSLARPGAVSLAPAGQFTSQNPFS